MKHPLWSVLILCVLLCVAGSTHAAGSNTAYAFLRADVSARAAALAGSVVSLTDDPNTLFFNPAGLGTVEQTVGSIGFFKHLLDINAGHVSYVQPIKGFGHLGSGVQYVNYGTFDETDDLGNTIGSFGASDLAVTIGYSNTLDDNLFYGINTKLIYSQIAGYASAGLAADVGLLYVIPESRVTLGAAIRNIGAQLSQFISTREKLPLDVIIGGSVVPEGLPLRLSVNFHKLNQDVEKFSDRFKTFSVGGEFTLSSVLQLRFGYNNGQRQDLKIGTSSGLAGFSGGFGVTVNDYKVDYGLSSLGKVGAWHRISIGATL